ncbi:unnamed protein product [Staurois parvus]|uniref:Diphthine synthase n=1 Tax=Staurois parvus TaxID=386267 RepID=A0ABN9GB23_9NEOB|nr:unnamed protein product [Staurois parvus]
MRMKSSEMLLLVTLPSWWLVILLELQRTVTWYSEQPRQESSTESYITPLYLVLWVAVVFSFIILERRFSIVFWTDSWKPESFYDKIRRNRLSGMHTLCLLDIKVKEQSIENLMKGKKVFDPPRYMTVNQAVEQLLQIVQNRRELGEELALTENTICVGLARVGASDQHIAAGTLQQLSTVDFGAPLHSLVISGCMHPLELDMLRLFAVDPSCFDQINVEDSSTIYLSS